MTDRNALIVGASGIVGRAAFEHFAAGGSGADFDGSNTFGVSRRAPDLSVGTHVPLDLMDAETCRRVLGDLPPMTHVVYAALYEKPGLIEGWYDPEQMETNRQMLANLLEAAEASGRVRHVSLLQGTKAYGAHVGRMRVPGRERSSRHPHDNFYWLQEDLLRERAARGDYAFTVWRPPVIYGHAFGAPMNPLAPLSTFAAVARHEGRPLCWPGGRTGPTDAMDARLLARALAWGANAAAARNEIFNISNGDVFVWENVWESLAAAFGMKIGSPEPLRLAEFMPSKSDVWDDVVRAHDLRSPALMDFVGDSFVYLDLHLGLGRDHAAPPNMLSTIKLRQAGFGDCIDSEDMLVEWIEWMQRERLIPQP